MRVIVVGACVIALSCAVRLAEAGYEVAVLARDLPLETTSAVAGAHGGAGVTVSWGCADEVLELVRQGTA